MSLDRLRAKEEGGARLAVGGPARHDRRHLYLLRRQLPVRGKASPPAQARRSELDLSPLGPRNRSKPLECREGRVEALACLGRVARAPQALAVAELRSCPLEWGRRAVVPGERVVELRLEVVGVRDEAAAAGGCREGPLASRRARMALEADERIASLRCATSMRTRLDEVRRLLHHDRVALLVILGEPLDLLQVLGRLVVMGEAQLEQAKRRVRLAESRADLVSLGHLERLAGVRAAARLESTGGFDAGEVGEVEVHRRSGIAGEAHRLPGARMGERPFAGAKLEFGPGERHRH